MVSKVQNTKLVCQIQFPFGQVPLDLFTDNTFLKYKTKSNSLFFMCLGLFQLDLCVHALHLKFQLLDSVY